jgi:nucleoside-diphosphate-sugar epimerase
MSSGESGNAYNISSDFDGKTLGDYAHFIAHLSNNNVIYDIEINSSVSKATYAILDCTKIKSLGWHAKYSACDAIRRTYLAKRID